MTRTADSVRIEELLAHGAWLRTLAGHLVDAARVEDVVQDTWVAAMRAEVPAERPRPWLAKVLRNVVRMGRRRDDRRAQREVSSVQTQRDVPTPEQILARVRLQRRLAERVTELDEPYRTTILLRYHEGLAGPEIARRLAVAEGTVRWRISRGLEQLRTELDREAGGTRSDWHLMFVPLLPTAESTARASLTPTAQGALMNAKLVAALSVATLGVGAAVVLGRDAPTTTDPSPAPAVVAATEVAAPDPPAPPSSPAPPADKPTRIGHAERDALLAAIERARSTRTGAVTPEAPAAAPSPDVLDKAYIRAQMQTLADVFDDCYAQALERRPDLAGTLAVRFAITGEPDVGGLVESSQVDADRSTIHDDQLAECIVESVYTLSFPPPKAGGHVVVSYPIELAPDDP